jgi:hypothetical protein
MTVVSSGARRAKGGTTVRSLPIAQCGGARIRQRGLGGIRTAAAPAPDGQRPTTPSAHEPLQLEAWKHRKPGHAPREFLQELMESCRVRYLQHPQSRG